MFDSLTIQNIMIGASCLLTLGCSQPGGFLARADGAIGEPINELLDGSTMTSTTSDGAVVIEVMPNEMMSFFVTSRGVEVNGQTVTGGNFGGIAGADAFCRQLALEVLPNNARTWRAYLSTTTENARDRIGTGPWLNFDGTIIADSVEDLHQAPPPFGQMITEDGSAGFFPPALGHGILTGSTPDGRAFQSLSELMPYFIFPDGSYEYPNKIFDFTCNNWSTDGTANGDSNRASNYAIMGHVDWDTILENRPGLDQRAYQWNAAHLTACDASIMRSDTSNIRLYCFAID